MMRSWLMLLSLAALTAALALPIGLSRPADAVTHALADCVALPETERLFQRYVWIPDGRPEGTQAVQFTLNVVSRASRVIRGKPVANGYLVRVDLRLMAPRDWQTAEMLELWDRMASEDPYFYLRTKVSGRDAGLQRVDSKPNDPAGSARFIDGSGRQFYRRPGGNLLAWNGAEWVESDLREPAAAANDRTQTLATFGGHVDLRHSTMLCSLTASPAPLVRYDFAVTRMLTTLDGGLYYEFAGIQGNQDDVFLALGADPKLSERLRSDQRAAVFRSDVTGKPRRIDVLHGAGGTTGFVAITHDLADETNDAARHPILNLLDFRDDARELIGEKSNGFHAFALFDGRGNLQRAVPDNVARDHTVPAPHTARLQPAIGCIRCHGADGGLRTFRNDVQAALQGDLDVFADFGSRDSISDVIDRLVGLYEGDLAKQLSRARSDYADAIFRATGGVQARAAAALVGNVHLAYTTAAVTPDVACRELGVEPPEGRAVETLRELLPPFDQGGLIAEEDPRLGFLKAGISVNRKDWEQVYIDAALRSQAAVTKQKGSPQ